MKRGFTLIEMLIVAAIILILAALIFGGKESATYSRPGICIDGYKFAKADGFGAHSSPALVQIIGDDGRPVKCQ